MTTDKTIIHKSYLPANNTISMENKKSAGTPPSGYARLNKTTPEVAAVAKKLLGGEFGTLTPFESNGVKYMARVEPHYHKPPPTGADPAQYPKPWGWHKGVTIYQKSDGKSENKLNNSPARKDLFQRIDDFLNQIKF